MRTMITSAAAALTLAAAMPALAQTSEATQAPSAATSAATPQARSAATAQTPSSATAPATSAAPASGGLSIGLPVKDKTGVLIGQIIDLKPGAGGDQATVKMGEQSFAIGAQSFVVQNGAAVINATADELKAMIANANKPG